MSAEIKTHTRRFFALLFLVTVMVGSGCTTMQLQTVEHQDQDELGDVDARSEREIAYEQMELMAEVITRVRQDYVDQEKTGYDSLITTALKGMLRDLDQHSQFMVPEKYEDMKDGTRGKFGGIGIVVGIKNERLTIVSPMEGTPGFEAGLRSSDIISQINGEKTRGFSMSEAVERLRGEIGSEVVLTIIRPDSREELEVTIKRAEITVSSIKGTRLLEDGIGYVRITQFSSPTEKLLAEALEELDGQGMDALVLDLRDNPGGLLRSAVAVSQMFLEENSLIVSTRGRPGAKVRKRRAKGISPMTDIPIVILVNQGSASASEIVAGALQDHKRAVLLGERTFGKGSVQTILPLSGGSALRLTTALYYTPSEKMIHNNGLEPDVVVPVTSEEWNLIRMKMPRMDSPEYYKQDDAAIKARFENVKDIQLERAVDLIKGLRIYQQRLDKKR